LEEPVGSRKSNLPLKSSWGADSDPERNCCALVLGSCRSEDAEKLAFGRGETAHVKYLLE